ncbi:MAG TPA: type 1 glutamine amidotransferase [Thiotrichaceae bacterium]|jgi:GMP synthase-like glutamine amidotransferase|nr:type 1 glutamine amidotransferase [Thiotrichaceae bacterium]HIM09086.1 type 1 glutamine amidotransferase [Gammaproteobacteria bacterium]
MNTKRILIFQHLAIEHPGIFREFFKEDGFELTTVELDEGDAIPDLTNFDAMWVMGGPMDVWQEERHPWLIEEKAAIRKAVNELKMPYVGICLGHQLLAAALGGEVGLGNETEVGIMQIHKTDVGKQSPFLNNMPDTMNCLQWHGAEVKTEPAGMEVLVSSDICGIQSLSLGTQVFTTQYHQEIIPSTVSDWSDIPAYKRALEKALGDNAAENLEKEALDNMDEFNKAARQLYENWKSVVF